MSGGCNVSEPAQHTAVKIEDGIHDPRIMAIVEKHRAELETAGVTSLRLGIEGSTKYTFVADDPKIKFDDSRGRSTTSTTVNGVLVEVASGYTVDGKTVEDVKGKTITLPTSLTTISPEGGNTKASNAAIEAIAKDLKTAGLGDFREAAIYRCIGSPTYLSKETLAPSGSTR